MTVEEVERIGEAQLPAADAALAIREYRQAMLRETNPQVRAEYLALWRANRARAAGHLLIDVIHVCKQTGLQPMAEMFPRLAMCRADASWCHVYMDDRGGATFSDKPVPSNRRIAKDHRFDVPDDTFARLNRNRRTGKALVPMVPPRGRPPGTALSAYHILWDAVWELEPPRDPFLLKHCGGSLYAVVFQWNLTPLEQAVMRGRLR